MSITLFDTIFYVMGLKFKYYGTVHDNHNLQSLKKSSMERKNHKLELVYP